MTLEFRDYPNIRTLFQETVTRHPDKAALQWYLDEGGEAQFTWRQFQEQTDQVAKSLMALGVGKGDKVNIISQTCPRWVISDLGITSIGACSVGIYPSNLAPDCQYIIDHSDGVLVFAEDLRQLTKLLEIREQIPAVRKVVLFCDDPPPGNEWVMRFEEFLELGRAIKDEDLRLRMAAVASDDPAGIIYTSGTTGVPKGVVLTHDNITFTAQSVLHSGDFDPDDVMFLFLPLAHVFARTCFNGALITGVTTIFARSLETLGEDLKRARPDWFISVPRIFEKVYAQINHGVEQKGGIAPKLFRWACQVGRQASDLKLKGEPLSMGLRLKTALADRLVFSKVRDAFGGRLRWCISGAAPLNPDLGLFFHACGVLILEGLGMTENTSFSNVNRPDNYRFGWVGPAGVGIEHKIAEDGEILFRGRNVMQGYYKMPAETAEVMTADGWLRSGDVGEIDAENFLRVTGRKKELIITSGGKNIAPAPLENLLVATRYINQAMVIGDKRNYLTALVTLDPVAIADIAKENDLDPGDMQQLIHSPAIRECIDREVAALNQHLPSYETIKKVCIVPEFTIDNGLLTPTMKLRKASAVERFRDEIEGMYAG
ncbi:MAG: long-chain fatty acid--CoA ligase [Desulfobacterales bacterium]